MLAGLIKATANTYINFNGGYLRTGLFVHLNVRPKFSVDRAVPRIGAEDAAFGPALLSSRAGRRQRGLAVEF